MRKPHACTGRSRRQLMTALLALPLLPHPALAQARRQIFEFTETVGQLSFTARHFGLLRSSGRFGRFHARVALDPNDPSRAEVALSVATASVDTAWPGGTEMLRSPAYFASDEHPMAHFTGRAEDAANPNRFAIAGALTLRGITRPMTLQAQLLQRAPAPDGPGELAEFSAAGEIDRTEFGMLAGRSAISDHIGLAVRVRLRLA